MNSISNPPSDLRDVEILINADDKKWVRGWYIHESWFAYTPSRKVKDCVRVSPRGGWREVPFWGYWYNVFITCVLVILIVIFVLSLWLAK